MPRRKRCDIPPCAILVRVVFQYMYNVGLLLSLACLHVLWHQDFGASLPIGLILLRQGVGSLIGRTRREGFTRTALQDYGVLELYVLPPLLSRIA